MCMILRKQLKLFNYGTRIRLHDGVATLAEGKVEDVMASEVYEKLKDTFVKSIKVCDEEKSADAVVSIRVKVT